MIQKQLQDMPPGKLICCHHKNHCKWYHHTDQNKSYISKKDKSLAEKLAIKKYLSLCLEDLQNEKRAIEFYLRHHSPSGKAEELLTNTSEYQNLLAPHFTPLSKELSDWVHTPYEKNPLHPENLNTKSISGNLVRSKSEMMIDTLLYLNKIPFRYECVLHLEETTIYPDFTINLFLIKQLENVRKNYCICIYREKLTKKIPSFAISWILQDQFLCIDLTP